MREPRNPMPGHTCPEIDEIIGKLEGLRAANSTLREWAEWWERQYDDRGREIEQMEREIERLQDEATESAREIKRLETLLTES